MARQSRDDRVDRLYQLPPEEFTRERNTLAKETGGSEGTRIRALPKPSVSAWAVNQLYWQDRGTYDVLVDASEKLRSAHRAVLGGRKADLRGADAAHREALKAALTSTLRLARAAGHNISSAAQGEIARTLESLPADGEAGRLAKPLRPGGFEALQGMPIRARQEEPEAAPPRARILRMPARTDKSEEARQRKQERREQQAARALERKARAQERTARAAVARLEQQLAAAEQRSAAARSALDRAQAAEAKVRGELEDAREALEQASRDVRRIERS
jgi:hypothetical protein